MHVTVFPCYCIRFSHAIHCGTLNEEFADSTSSNKRSLRHFINPLLFFSFLTGNIMRTYPLNVMLKILSPSLTLSNSNRYWTTPFDLNRNKFSKIRRQWWLLWCVPYSAGSIYQPIDFLSVYQTTSNANLKLSLDEKCQQLARVSAPYSRHRHIVYLAPSNVDNVRAYEYCFTINST